MDMATLIGITGELLRTVRKDAGWNRPRLARALAHRAQDDSDFRSIKSLERYEGLLVVPPLVVQRYREAIGAELFDALLELARKKLGALKRRREEAQQRRTRQSRRNRNHDHQGEE